ncbi:MAG: response regulator transcription factor [Bryobacterales bacterium]|nr:response regulator transcription factor [Bryobacterales bacterium]
MRRRHSKIASTQVTRFLIVDDDRDLTALLAEYFAGAGIATVSATDGAKGLAKALEGGFDLVILDVMLPHMDGFELLRQLRKRSNVPVIMLTARGEREDRIAGLRSGADDYLPKPFDPDELLARAKAILRRTRAPELTVANVSKVGELTIDMGRRTVLLRGEPVEVTALELEILDLLARPAGRVVSRDEISGVLYQRPVAAFDRTVDVHVSRLRRKVEPGGVRIRGVRGVGYVLSAGLE